MKHIPFHLFVIFLLAACGDGRESVPAPATGAPETRTENKPSAPDSEGNRSTSPKVSDLPSPAAYFDAVQTTPIDPAVPVGKNENKPVILIVVDALNPTHLSPYGYSRDTSPHMAALAADGVLFTNWISNSSWTRPSFTSIITGLTKKQHRVELTGQNLDRKIVTLAESYRQAGYRTAGFVGNPLVRKIWAFDQGFQTYEDTTDHKAFPRARILADKAISWMTRSRKKPFYMMLFFTDSHTPYRPPGSHRKYLEDIGATENIEYPFREYKKPLAKPVHNAIVAAYDGEISYVDSQIGRIVDELKRLGLYDDATIVITADHGEMFGQHNCYLHAYHHWEQAVRVPFFIKSPALPKNVRNDRPHSHVDLMPSLLEISGIPLPEGKPGMSIGQMLQNPDHGGNRPLFSQYNAHTVRRQGARIGRWKLVHHHKVDRATVYKKLGELSQNIPRAHPKDLPSLAYDGEQWELYDLVADPAEENNLYETRKDDAIVTELKKIIDANELSDALAAESTAPTLSEDTLEALKAAGYIQ